MRKVLTAIVALAALAIPTAALARTPATGAKKLTIATAAFRGADRTEHAHIFVSPHQMQACFNVWTDDGFALLDPSRRYRHGECNIQIISRAPGAPSGPYGWQPTNLITHNTRGHWGLRANFDQVTVGQLHRWHIPVPVLKNLFHIHSDKAYPFVP